jgi:predicted DNA-binding protein
MSTTNVKQVACYLTPAQHEALKRLSAQSGAPLQHYLRQAVDQFLKKQTGKDKK